MKNNRRIITNIMVILKKKSKLIVRLKGAGDNNLKDSV